MLGLPEEYGVFGFWGLLDSGYLRCVSLAALFALGSGHYFYVLLYLTVNCQFLSRLRSTSAPFFWEITSGYAVFSASWFDSGYMFMSVYGDVVVLTEFSVKVDSDPEGRSRFGRNSPFFLCEGGLGPRSRWRLDEFHTISV